MTLFIPNPEKKLFSPGPVESKYSLDLTFSHRSSEFQQLYLETSNRLLKTSGYKHVIMTQGSATSAIETVLSSTLKSTSRLLILVNGEFARRAAHMAAFYSNHVTTVTSLESLIHSLETGEFDFCFMVMFETSLSLYNSPDEVSDICKRRGIALIIDAVSAFPYYPPVAAQFFVTTSSKQLRGLPAMGLIFYDDLNVRDLQERSDYLNLKKYVEYAEKSQTPHTSLIPQIDSLNNELAVLDIAQLRAYISQNARTVTEGLEDKIVNERICPVVTFKTKTPNELVEALRVNGVNIYQNLFYMTDYIQVGCFNYADQKNYIEVNELLRRFIS